MISMQNRSIVLAFDQIEMEYLENAHRTIVFQNLSFEVMRGEFVSILGPSGCGKTTIINIAAGFIFPTCGQVLYDGHPIKGPGKERGVVFQQYGVFPWLTIEQNIKFGLLLAANSRTADETRNACDMFLSRMGLTEFRSYFPKQLSGGMLQRVALARAYAVDPKILLLDEPFGALDDFTRVAMRDLLLGLLDVAEKTVILSTHSIDEALYLSDRIFILSKRPSRILDVVTLPSDVARCDRLRGNATYSTIRSHIEELVFSPQNGGT